MPSRAARPSPKKPDVEAYVAQARRDREVCQDFLAANPKQHSCTILRSAVGLAKNLPMDERLAHHSVVDPSTGCRLWTGAIDSQGYGQTSIKAKRYLAHKAAYECAIGPVPAGMCVLHRCDTPGCINPAHLFLGTRGDNNTDRARKGRNSPRLGEQHHLVKLTEADVLAIRADDRPSAVICKEYRVSQSCVSRIKTRGTWKHI